MSQQFKCPKCPGFMRTYTRSGLQIEQCDQCRGVFLDYGELESLNRAEQQWNTPAPPPPPPPAYPQQPAYGAPQPVYAAPAWGASHGGHYSSHGHHKHKSFGKMLFSS